MNAFEELKIKETILKGIQELGFTTPFPIQSQPIPLLLDGNDVVEVYETIKECSEKIKKLSRPFLIEARTFRLRGHEEASGTKYVPKEIIEQWKKKDPIDIFEKKIIEKGIITKVEIKKIT